MFLPTMLKEYLAYIKNNPQGYWFRARWYGLGWVPATWQGWLVMLVFFAYVLWLAAGVPDDARLADGDLPWFLGKLALGVFALITIAYLKGEKPSWHWGPRE
jgi:hypothetical protein